MSKAKQQMGGKEYSFKRTRNWQLGLGGILVTCAILTALLGPAVAPHDPMKIHYIIQHPETGEFVKTPFKAFTMPGFPLGTDAQGRDILSQLLYAIRPTLQLVLLLAVLRLGLGILIGLAAGWSTRRRGRLLDTLISASLAVPVIFIALCIIAASGIRLGAWTFIIGLSLTGWAETARLVRDQARKIKYQPYIESARALGLSSRQILSGHVLPQIMPLVWMLMSFEISNTLIALAGLGFLGYYVNAVWVPLGDWSALRTSGKPELGQMLASGANLALNQPWLLLAAGSAVFFIVLAFYLIGEGLRIHAQYRRATRRASSPVEKAMEVLSQKLEERWTGPLTGWQRRWRWLAGISVFLAILAAGGSMLWQTYHPANLATAIKNSGGHYWPSERHDAQGSLWAELLGPKQPSLLWTFEDAGRFPHGPAVAADGTIFIASGSGYLYALGPDGSQRWKEEIPAEPVGGVALNAAGEVHVLDNQGHLSKFSSSGELLWSSQPMPSGLPISSPVMGSDGRVFFATSDNLVAVGAAGETLWLADIPKYSYLSARLRLSSDERYIFFEDLIVDSRDGQVLTAETLDPLDRFIVGTNGLSYLVSQNQILELDPDELGGGMRVYAVWDAASQGLGTRLPEDSGLIPDGRVWVMYASSFEFAKLIWVNQEGEIISTVAYSWRGDASKLIGMDQLGTAYVCGVGNARNEQGKVMECRATPAGRSDMLWEIALGKGDYPRWTDHGLYQHLIPSGGALAPGRLYLTTYSGLLLALGDE